MIIREMPSTERPRDKGLRYGVRSLSSRELLALIFTHWFTRRVCFNNGR